MMYMMLFVGVIVALSLTATQSSRATDTPCVCEQFHDVKLENQSFVFAAPSPAETDDGREHGVINMPIRWHIISNDRFILESRAREVNNWIEKQLENSSMSHRWSNKMAVKTGDIKFKIYLTESVKNWSLQELRYLENITILNSTVLNSLGYGRVCTNYDLIEEKFHLKGSYGSRFLYCRNNCPEAYQDETPCKEVLQHWGWVCDPSYFFLQRGDILYFNFTELNYSVTTDFHQDVGLTNLLYTSNNNADNFTLNVDIDGPISIRIQNSTGYDGVLTVNLIKKCQHINNFSAYWKDYVNPGHINVIMSTVLLEPTMDYGMFEYGINLSNEAPVIVLLKSIHDKIEADDESFWGQLSKAFGASIRKEDYQASCEDIKSGFTNDTIEALEQATKLRCRLYNSVFGKKFNRTQIFVKFSNGETSKLYVPAEKISEVMTNHTLSCNAAKVCTWEIVKTAATTIPSTPTPSAPTTSKSVVVPTNSTCHAGRSCHEAIKEIKIIYEFYNDDDVSSLSYQDIAEWTRKRVKTHTTHYCVSRVMLKMTLPVNNDINEINRDLVSVQYELKNGKLYIIDHKICRMRMVETYDCNKEEENNQVCRKHKRRGLQTWHIISFSISGVLSIVACALIAFYCHIRRKP